MVPASMETDVIKNAHEKGHGSAKKTQDVIKQEYYIPHLKNKVEKYISNCVRCIIANKKEGKQEGFLQSLLKPDIPLHTFHMDHLGPLQSTCKRYNHILAIIGQFYQVYLAVYDTIHDVIGSNRKNGQTEEHIWKSSLCNYR